MKPLARIQALTTFLASAFGAPATRSREQELVRCQAVLYALEIGQRADFMIDPLEAEALGDTIEVMTGAGEKLFAELLDLVEFPEPLIDPPAAPSSPSSPAATSSSGTPDVQVEVRRIPAGEAAAPQGPGPFEVSVRRIDGPVAQTAAVLNAQAPEHVPVPAGSQLSTKLIPQKTKPVTERRGKAPSRPVEKRDKAEPIAEAAAEKPLANGVGTHPVEPPVLESTSDA